VKRFLLLCVLISVAAAVLAASAAAVEVTVKSDTELYNNGGKVIQDATAGQRFKAKKASGEWAYGFLTLSAGGANGWIKLDALELDNDARRKLGLPPAADEEAPDELQGEAILLRFRPEPGQLLVYETDAKMVQTLTGESGQLKVDVAQTDVAQSQLTMKCKRRAADGRCRFEVCCRKMQYRRDWRQRENTLRFVADGTKATLHRNNVLMYSGEWGAHELQGQGLPDLSKLVGAAVTVRFSDRAETVGSARFNALVGAAGVNALLLSTPVQILPEESLRVGSSWTQELTLAPEGGTGEGPQMPHKGELKHTILERTTLDGRPCVRIHVDGTASRTGSPEEGRAAWGATGTYMVDEETGVILTLNMMVSVTINATVNNIPLTLKNNGTVTIRYTGDTIEEDEQNQEEL